MKGNVPTARTKENEEKRILRGHLWIYKNEILESESINDGEIVDIYSSKGKFICRGFFQKNGNIFARVLSLHQEEVNQNFFIKKLAIAQGLRKTLFPGSDVYRWVHAESDGLPGLVIDRYQSIVTVHSQCYFYNRYGNYLIEAIKSFDGIQDVCFKSTENSDIDIHKEVICNINNLKFCVPIRKSQKTGLFLDQRLNYIYSQKYMRDSKVLDCFCYMGLWTCHCIQAGANHVVGIDSSKEAISTAQKNLEINGYKDKATFYHTEVESYFQENHEEFDVIILDPPAYAKKKNDFKKAFAKYQKINSLAFKFIKKGGFLITCSCSHFISPEDFREIIKRSARSVTRDIRLLEFHGASPDHPEILIMPELSYLKCAIFQVF